MTQQKATGGPLPQITDRLTWQAKIDELRVKEKPTPGPGTHWPPNAVGCRWSKSIRRLH
jgi:hypothetical protein